MLLKDKITAEPGFQYVADQLELMSAAGRRRMMQQPFVTDRAELEREYDNTERIVGCLQRTECTRAVAVIRHQLMQMHDLQGSLANLSQRMVMEEIELFEIKNLAFLCMETCKAAATLGIDNMLAIPDLSAVFDLLDPDHTQIPNFYIYDSYHPDLGPLRRELKARQTLLDNCKGSDDERASLQREVNDLFERQNTIQQQIVAQLSDRLYAFSQPLRDAFERMAYTDFLFARATMADEWKLCRPKIESNKLCYRSLWNPRLRRHNEEQGMRYQPVDISLGKGVCLVTGANMAGKTVMLKTVGIAQLMAQFAMFIPAGEAAIALVDDVVFCIGDEQNEMNGLSSFASEIIKISDTVTRAEQENLLILIDEPARTTNPVEGKAIVQSVATLLEHRTSTTLITTHYSQLGLGCRRLRVKGFVEDMADVPLTPENINSFMDYSLLPDDSDEVPQEALRIAAILHCNSDLLDTAAQFLNRQ
ncbi:MAG: DNA mismatch repair protein MutS [Bacteroidales bacterium]|nr:DNA mismatch repair protein MutS [Bacteroidales bacterium]